MRKIILFLLLWIVGFAGFGQESYSFKKPVNKADSLEINLEYTKICLGKFYEQHDIGVYFTAIGTIVLGGSSAIYATSVNNPTDNDKIIFGSVSAVGGVIALAGIIISMDSYKWLNRARLQPVLTPSGGSVIFKF